VLFDHVHIREMAHYGFDPHGEKVGMEYGQNLTITNCISENNGWDGFTIDQTLNIIMENNLAFENGRNGFNIVTGSSYALIKNNTAINNGYTYYNPAEPGCGISVQNDFNFGTTNVQIVANIFLNNKLAGVCLNNVTQITIANNTIDGTCNCINIISGKDFYIDGNLCAPGNSCDPSAATKLVSNGALLWILIYCLSVWM